MKTVPNLIKYMNEKYPNLLEHYILGTKCTYAYKKNVPMPKNINQHVLYISRKKDKAKSCKHNQSIAVSFKYVTTLLPDIICQIRVWGEVCYEIWVLMWS